MISPVNKNEYNQLVKIWEASVRATHIFLKEEDIVYLRPLIRNKYLDAVDLYGARDQNGCLTGFMGISGERIEMLFIHPEHTGKGIGKEFIHLAVGELKCRIVEVNEQNQQAVGFYLKMGFEVTGRSEVDDTGKAFPILKMELKK